MSEVDGSVDNTAIAFKFAEYFSNCYVCNNPERAAEIEHNYVSMRATYSGFPMSSDFCFDTELVSKIIMS